MAFCADRIINDTCIAWDRLKGSNVLITGGTGLVGSVITRALIEANRPAGTDIAITLLVRNTDKARKIFGDDINSINLIESDLTDGQGIEGSYDFIIHCAAVTASSVMVANPVETIDLSYRGTRRMLELARKCNSKGMVYVSSMEVYGVTDESMNPVTEDRLGYVDLGNVRSSYQESKRICELLCNSYASEYKVPVCSARLAQTFGAGVSPDEGRVFAQFAKSVTDGRDIVLHTTGESYGNYCDTTDMAAAVLCLLTRGVPGEAYNVANEDNSCMIREMAQMCADTIAEGRIKVVYDISDSYGYAPATKLKLSSAKMRSLGWTSGLHRRHDMAPAGTSDTIRKISVPESIVLTDSDRDRLRSILTDILNDIQDVADKNGIEFELGGGSVLGAVRHGGFIPWDDDIDINIRRSEWNRLLPALTSCYKDKYDILLPGSGDGYALLFPQIRLAGTSLKTRDDVMNSRCGVPVDVFIIENTYNNPVRRFIHGIGCQYHGFAVSCRKFYRDREFLTMFAKGSGNRKLISSTRTKIFWGRLMSFRSLDKMIDRADRWNGRCKDENSKYVTVPTGRRHFFGELRERSVMFPPSQFGFEGRTRPCPASADLYLTQLYGDYKKIPAADDRESHIYFEPLDLG